MVASDPRAIPLLVVPAVTVFLAYRAYLLERQRHERLEFLYEATRTLARSPEIMQALEGLLARSLEAFRAELAEIVLFSSDGGPPLRTTLGPGDYRQVMEPIDPEIAEELRALVDADGPSVRLERPFGSQPLRRYLDGRLVTDAMLAMLPGENRVIGTIMLANRFGVIRSFSDEDLKLFETLANNASVALQYDRLEQAVLQLRTLQEQLHHQAFHDPLTDLAQPVALHQPRQGGARTRGPARSPCCSSTSTTSRPSTTASATPRATSCWSRSPTGFATRVRPARHDRAPRRRRVRRDGPRDRTSRTSDARAGLGADHAGLPGAGRGRRRDDLGPPQHRDRDHPATAATRTS